MSWVLPVVLSKGYSCFQMETQTSVKSSTFQVLPENSVAPFTFGRRFWLTLLKFFWLLLRDHVFKAMVDRLASKGKVLFTLRPYMWLLSRCISSEEVGSLKRIVTAQFIRIDRIVLLRRSGVCPRRRAFEFSVVFRSSASLIYWQSRPPQLMSISLEHFRHFCRKQANLRKLNRTFCKIYSN